MTKALIASITASCGMLNDGMKGKERKANPHSANLDTMSSSLALTPCIHWMTSCTEETQEKKNRLGPHTGPWRVLLHLPGGFFTGIFGRPAVLFLLMSEELFLLSPQPFLKLLHQDQRSGWVSHYRKETGKGCRQRKQKQTISSFNKLHQPAVQPRIRSTGEVGPLWLGDHHPHSGPLGCWLLRGA